MNSLQWTQTLLSVFLQTSLLLLCATAFDKYVSSSVTRVRFWTCTYISILSLIAAALLLPRLQWFHPWSQVEPRLLLDAARAQHFAGVSFLAIWVLGILVMVVSWLTRFCRLRRLLGNLLPLTDVQQTKVSKHFEASALMIGKRPVQLLQGNEQLGPFCYQLHTPLIVLPPSLFESDDADFINVLMHELTHLRSRHAMQLFLERVAQIVLWFQPLIWASSRRASLVREYECDDAAATNRFATIAYLKTLIRLAEATPSRIEGTLAIGRSPSQLKLRALRLLNRPQTLRSIDRRIYAYLPLLLGMALSQLWLPTNPLSSRHSRWSAWPTWTASVLHEFGVPARDFEKFDPKTQLHELVVHESRDPI